MSRLSRAAKSVGGSKPKVLLVDDHRGVLERVSAILAGDFDVAGMATTADRRSKSHAESIPTSSSSTSTCRA